MFRAPSGDRPYLLLPLPTMPALLALLMVVIGVGVLTYGADLLVRGAVAIASAARVSAAVIGLTIVSMGTSLPELVVSVAAALRGSADLSIGNVVGSNIFNIGVVLGVSALILPMRVHGSAVKLEWPFMFLASFQLLLLARDGVIDRLEGGYFLAGIVLFTWYAVVIGREAVGVEETADLSEEVERHAVKAGAGTAGAAIGLIAAGVGLLVIGGELLVRGSVELARAAGMTERVIGLTIVAAGTSAPELFTSIVAARRGQSEIALGNVIGSNIFNVLGILGVSALLTPLAVAPEMIRSDFWWMLGLSLVIFPMMRSKAVVTRLEGFLLVTVYVVYLTLLVLGV